MEKSKLIIRILLIILLLVVIAFFAIKLYLVFKTVFIATSLLDIAYDSLVSVL